MFQDAPGGRPHGTNLPAALDEEEQELWRQLRRKRDFEGRVAEKRAQLAELRDRRRAVSTAHAEARASVEQLAGELSFAEERRWGAGGVAARCRPAPKCRTMERRSAPAQMVEQQVAGEAQDRDMQKRKSEIDWRPMPYSRHESAHVPVLDVTYATYLFDPFFCASLRRLPICHPCCSAWASTAICF